jgi:segregation and condensation protein B
MAFNLKLVLKALLFSSSQALSIKDIQGVLARFHEQAGRDREQLDANASEAAPVPAGESVSGESVPATPPSETPASENVATPGETNVAGAPLAGEAPLEVPAEAPEQKDAELYGDVPSLITATQIREAMAMLAEELRSANDIYLLIEGPSGYRLVTHPRFAGWIRILRDEPPPVRLTQSALETLAIVAYRQPTTRTEIETIRGVSADAGINKLLERELIYITGRADLPGRPLQYGTTDKFMDFVGVKSLVELPASDVLSPRQIDEWLKDASSTKPPTDAEMGLPLEEGEGATPNLENVEIEHIPSAAEASVENSASTAAAPIENESSSSAASEAPPAI